MPAVNRRRGRTRLHAVAVVACIATVSAFLSLACSSDPAEPGAGGSGGPDDPWTIGPEGGTVATDDGGLALTVPPGALDQPVTITATPAPGSTSLPVLPGTIWELGPAGTQFAEPAELTIRYDPADFSGDPEDLRIAWVLEAAGELELTGHLGQDAAAYTVTGAIRGFGAAGGSGGTGGPAPSLFGAEGESTGAVARCRQDCAPPPDLRAEYLGATEGVELSWPTPTWSWVRIYRAALRQCEPGETSGQYGPYTCVSSSAEALTPPYACVVGDVAPDGGPCYYTLHTHALGHLGGTTDRWLGSRGAIFYYLARGGLDDDPHRFWSWPPDQATHFGTPDPPETPANFTARAVSETSIELTWQPTPTASGYELERLGADGFSGPLAFSDFFYLDENLLENTTYDYRIRSVNEHGVSAYASASATTGDLGGGPGCEDFELHLDFNPVEVAGGSSDVVPVFIERAAGFSDQIELGLFSVPGGPFWSDVMQSYAFSPNPADGSATSSTFSFTMREDVSAGDSYDFEIRGGSPLLETDPDECTIPITFEVIQ